MSKNIVRQLRRLLRKRYTFLNSYDIHVGKSGPKREEARLIFYYNYAEQNEKLEKLLTTLVSGLKEPYNNISHSKTLHSYVIIIPVNEINAISGLILLNS